MVDYTKYKVQVLSLTLLFSCLLLPFDVLAHGVASSDASYLQQIHGIQFFPFVYLGGKHMVTGYDHLLFLWGVVFFLYRMKEVGLYVTLFAIGHSMTLLYGVLSGIQVNAYLVDAVIGLSVVYKALDNLSAFKQWFNWQPDARWAVLLFGLFHGFGLATKLQDLQLAKEGLLVNMLSFNLGVELGQLLALAVILIFMSIWRRSSYFSKQADAANLVLMTLGFILTGYQLASYWLG